ncbi:hypothetical protein BGZ82_010573 [Podila clonocystis]|nr:hypothetical protein BGZ82_010573 [Podila clonocystis]
MPTRLRTQYLLVSLLIASAHAGPRDWRVDADMREALCANQQAMNELWVCIESCEAKAFELEPAEQEQQQQKPEVEQRPMRTTNLDTTHILALIAWDDDFDQDDFDAIDEVHLLRQKSRLESDPYYRSSNDVQDFVSANKQRQILHKQQWLVAQAQNPSKIENHSLTVHDKVLKHSDCVAKCDVTLACGTESSPDYAAGLDSVYPM